MAAAGNQSARPVAEGSPVPSRFAAKLESLGFSLPGWCLPPTEQLVREYETRLGLTLPADYREFLVHHGGVDGSATCAFQEPTPCGDVTCIDTFCGFTRGDRHDNVAQATELIDGAPDVVAIADNLMGAMFWLKCSGPDRDYVYMHDPEGRSAWSDQMFYDWYPSVHPTIKEYLAMRKRGELPKKPKGYHHVYRVAKSFTEFVDRLEKAEE
jgi:SMI1 / KNR4 family (SUKH-1)